MLEKIHEMTMIVPDHVVDFRPHRMIGLQHLRQQIQLRRDGEAHVRCPTLRTVA